MAQRHKSAIKRHTQSVKRAARNQSIRTHLRHTIRELRRTLEEKNTAKAAEMLPTVIKTITKAASKGVIHRNSASRRVSRLTTQVDQLKAAS